MAEAGSHTATTLAHTGTAELHAEPSALGVTAPGWVALSMLVVIAIMLWQKVPGLIARTLDGRIDAIREQLDHATRLRAEAEVLLAEATARQAASAGDAEAIVAHAQAEAAALMTKAQADSAELVRRRGLMAEDKIAAAERTALAGVRAHAAAAAARAAGELIATHHGADADRALVDRTIGGLGRVN